MLEGPTNIARSFVMEPFSTLSIQTFSIVFANLISSSLLGDGNRAIMFKVNQNNFLVVSNKNSISNILRLNDIEEKISEKKLWLII